MNLSLINTLYIILFSQSFFFGVFMIFQRKLFVLGIFFIALASHMLLNLGYENGLLKGIPNVTFVWGLLYPPSLYFYFKEMLNRDFQWNRYCALHYLPWLILEIFILTGEDIYRLLPFIMPLSILGYLGFTIKEVFKFRRIAQLNYSQDIQPMVNWAVVILVLYCGIIAFDLVRSLLNFIWPEFSDNWMNSILVLLLLILVNLMLVKRLTQPKIFSGISAHDVFSNSPSSRDNKQHQALMKRLEDLMAIEKPYLKANIALSEIAETLAISEKNLSAAINAELKQNFSAFINHLRVEAAKDLLLIKNDNKRNITEIFYMVGFNSKASFNLMFKKFTGSTPSEYRKNH